MELCTVHVQLLSGEAWPETQALGFGFRVWTLGLRV